MGVDAKDLVYTQAPTGLLYHDVGVTLGSFECDSGQLVEDSKPIAEGYFAGGQLP